MSAYANKIEEIAKDSLQLLKRKEEAIQNLDFGLETNRGRVAENLIGVLEAVEKVGKWHDYVLAVGGYYEYFSRWAPSEEWRTDGGFKIAISKGFPKRHRGVRYVLRKGNRELSGWLNYDSKKEKTAMSFSAYYRDGDIRNGVEVWALVLADANPLGNFLDEGDRKRVDDFKKFFELGRELNVENLEKELSDVLDVFDRKPAYFLKQLARAGSLPATKKGLDMDRAKAIFSSQPSTT